MDIKDGFATSSKENLRSIVCVHELGEITSKCYVGAPPGIEA
jgi:hypothetical protein